MSEHKPVGGTLCTVPSIILLIVIFAALFCTAQRFIYGIGAVSNMNDGYPWGVWITYDVVVGTSFACGGYAMALLVYVFNKMEYHPLVRPALLASLLGYSLAAASVFVDIGRYWNMGNVLLPWFMNNNSVLMEVAVCIALYTMVLLIEFAPVFLEKIKADKLRKRLDKVLFLFIALGILLPSMHQSSLGSVMIAAGQKLSPLWWTGLLPLLFLISALTMGYGVVVFESTLSSTGFNRPLESGPLSKISAIIPWLIVAYLVVRFLDLIVRGKLGLAFNGDLYGNMFILENLLLIIPMVMLFSKKCRNNPPLLFVGSVILMIAGGVYRFNTYIVGFNPGDGWQYYPAVPEILITFGIIAAEIWGYMWLVKRLPVLPAIHKHA